MTSEILDREIDRVIRRLAALARAPGSGGERAAAELIAEQMRRRGARTMLEREQVHGTYWVPVGLACAASAVAGCGTPSLPGAILAAIAAATLIDDLEIGRRPLRRSLEKRLATNVIAQYGAENPIHTLIVHAHHDAARTGVVFDPALPRFAARHAARVIERAGGTPPPMWGAVLGALAVTAGAAASRPKLSRIGAALSAAYAGAMANIASSPTVPGANDNLSGVAVLLGLAEYLRRTPLRNLRVLLLSTGSEESFLESMQRFGERHFPQLPRASTTFLCLESVGSPELMLLDGEGLLSLHRYPYRLIELLSELAREHGISLHAPFRYRLATDGQVPLRAGYPTAVISSIDWYKAPSNYHWPSDRPSNLSPRSVADALSLAQAFIERLEATSSGSRWLHAEAGSGSTSSITSADQEKSTAPMPRPVYGS